MLDDTPATTDTADKPRRKLNWRRVYLYPLGLAYAVGSIMVGGLIIAQGLEGALVRRILHAVFFLLLSATWLVALKIVITRYERARKRHLKAARIMWWIFLGGVAVGFADDVAYGCLWLWYLLFSAR